jgi:hypothetical protein
MWRALVVAVLLVAAADGRADPPVASYIFPAGGRRGTTVDFRLGGLNLHANCSFEMLGPGVRAGARLHRTRTVWFEGPMVPLPESQQAEDYPKDMAGRVRIAADAPLGVRHLRVWNSQGATPALKFMVGDLPEVVEHEIDGDQVPVEVKLPVTINGRIFPRENVDVWSFHAYKGQSISCEVYAARLGSPLDSRLEVRDPRGRRIAENDDAFGADSFVRFTAPADGTYQVRIHDISFRGGQAFVYRLTLTADPWVDRVYPLGGRRGSKTRFELAGQGLPTGPVDIRLPAGGRDDVHRLAVAGKLTNPFPIELDDLPEYLEKEPNDTPAQAQPVKLPAVLNGRIGKPGDVDYWAISAAKGDVYEFDLRAGRLGSPLDAVLAVLDGSGKELARSDQPGAALDDPHLPWTAPAGGSYLVRVSGRFRGRGGPEYAYRLRIDHPPAPDFRLRLTTDALTLDRKGQTTLKVVAERLGGMAEPIALQLAGVPRGVIPANLTIGANQGSTDIALHTDAAAPITAARVMVRGTAAIKGRRVTRTATVTGLRGEPELDAVLLAVAMPTPFKVRGDHDYHPAPRGTVHHRRFRIERGGFKGPIEVSLADRQMRHLQGVTGPTVTVPPGKSAFDYAIRLPPWMETGRTCRAVVMAVGVVKDGDGREHVLSFSSVEPSEQVVVVVEPGRLDVETERRSIRAVAGKTVAVAVRVSRGKGINGDVELELVVPSHLRGVAAERVRIPAGRERAVLSLRFGSVLGPFNMPVVIRATTMYRGEPVVAETKVEIGP